MDDAPVRVRMHDAEVRRGSRETGMVAMVISDFFSMCCRSTSR